MRTPIATLFLAAVLGAGATAASPVATLQVEHAWARATPPGASVAAAYLVLDNRGRKADRLLSLSSPRAGRVEVHAIVHEGDVAKMQRIDPLHLGAGERLVLEPGGTHIMLIELVSPLVAGERVPLLLRFEVAGEVAVEAVVTAAGDADSAHRHH